MSTIQEIELAITQLSPEDRTALIVRMAELDAQAWDEKFESDVKSGKLDWLAEEARQEKQAGRCTEREDSMSMKHTATARFWKTYHSLPKEIQKQADRAYEYLCENPQHPSLQFKNVGDFWSVRVGLHYRALAVQDGQDFNGSGSVPTLNPIDYCDNRSCINIPS